MALPLVTAKRRKCETGLIEARLGPARETRTGDGERQGLVLQSV